MKKREGEKRGELLKNVRLVPVLYALVNWAERRRSPEDAPTATVNCPTTSLQSCFSASQTLLARVEIGNAIVLNWPGAREILVKPLSCRGGSPASGGKLR